MMTNNQAFLLDRANTLAQHLNNLGLTAATVETSLRANSIKVHVAHGDQDLGYVCIYSGKEGDSITFNELCGPRRVDEIIKRVWYGPNMEAARRAMEQVFSARSAPSPVLRAFVASAETYDHVGYGAVVLHGEDTVAELFGKCGTKTYGNVGGEIDAVLRVLDWCAENGHTNVAIHHAFDGLAHWVLGRWEAKTNLVSDYVRRVKTSGIVVAWHHMKAKSGDEHHARARDLARQGAASDTETGLAA